MTGRRLEYKTPAMLELRDSVAEYFSSIGLGIDGSIDSSTINLFRNAIPTATVSRVSTNYDELERLGIMTEGGILVSKENPLWRIDSIRTVGDYLAKGLSKTLWGSSPEEVELDYVELKESSQRPLRFGITLNGNTKREFYWKPMSVSRMIGTYLWNLLSGREKHNFAGNTDGIIEEAIPGIHEWELHDSDIETEEYKLARLRMLFVASQVGIDDIVEPVLNETEDEAEDWIWRTPNYLVLEDMTPEPIDFDYVGMNSEKYLAFLQTILNNDQVSPEQYAKICNQEFPGLTTRFSQHAESIDSLLSALSPQIKHARKEAVDQIIRGESSNEELTTLVDLCEDLQRKVRSYGGRK